MKRTSSLLKASHRPSDARMAKLGAFSFRSAKSKESTSGSAINNFRSLKPKKKASQQLKFPSTVSREFESTKFLLGMSTKLMSRRRRRSSNIFFKVMLKVMGLTLRGKSPKALDVARMPATRQTPLNEMKPPAS